MEKIVKYIYEAGMLKRVSRSGWWAEKVKYPESVADHALRTAIIAFILARMEGLDEQAARKLCSAAVFHDMHETRLGDMNKVTARYITNSKELERKVEEEQLKDMPKEIRDSVIEMLELSEKERTILKDADYLECAFQAKEYLDVGYKGAETWIRNVGKKLQTESAKKLHAQMKDQDSNSWWKGLKKID